MAAFVAAPLVAVSAPALGFGVRSSRRVSVRAGEKEPQVVLNPDLRKDEEKVVDTVLVGELEKPLTAYCRCWRSKTFPLCNGAHVKHNKKAGDNVGPLLLKK